MARLLVYTSPEAERVLPLVPGLLAVKARGHEVRVRTGPDLVDVLGAAGIYADAIDPRIPEFEAGAGRGGTVRRRLTGGLEPVLRRAPYEGRDMRRAIERHDPDAVLADAIAYGAVVSAEASGVPWGVTQPSLLGLRGERIPAFGLGAAPAGGAQARVRQQLMWRQVERAFNKDLLPTVNNLRREAELPELPTFQHHLVRPHVLMVLSGPPLEYPRADAPINVRFVGPGLWDPPAAVPEWLAAPGDPWVIVRAASQRRGDERFLQAVARGLQAELVRVAIATEDAVGASVPETPNLHLVRSLPLAPALEHAAVLVTHGELSLVQRALAAGVPVVAVPAGGEEPEVAGRLERTGAGVAVPLARISPARLRAAVTEAMELRDVAARVGLELAASGGPEAFAAAVAEILDT